MGFRKMHNFHVTQQMVPRHTNTHGMMIVIIIIVVLSDIIIDIMIMLIN